MYDLNFPYTYIVLYFLLAQRTIRDVSNFDKEFTDASPDLTPTEDGIIDRIDDELFKGFSYTNPNLTD